MQEKTKDKNGTSYFIALSLGLIITEVLFKVAVEAEFEETFVKILIIAIPLLLSFKRYKWSKWVLIFILFLNATISILGAIEIQSIVLYIVGIYNIYFVLVIYFSPKIQRFYGLQNNEPSSLDNERPKSDTSIGKRKYPYLITRVKATFIDSILLFGLFAFIMVSVQDPELGRPIAFVVFILIALLYEPLMLANFSATLGHKIMNIKVVKYEHPKEKINVISGIFRIIIKLLLGWMSFLTIHMNPDHRALHDYASSSVVILNE